jgi:tRNA (guanine-N7-)-methyltransferase
MIDLKPVRSYVKRQGRITTSQKSALLDLWPRFGLSSESGDLNSQVVFGREAPLWLEIGFGMGEAFVECAKTHPEANVIGVEVHSPGIGRTLHTLAEQELKNVRIYQEDVNLVLSKSISQNSLDRVQIFFPDPWPKKRHHKRRLISNEFLDVLAEKLKPNALLYLSTDWQDYADWMLEHLNAHPAFTNRFPETISVPVEQIDRFQTKFERRGLKLGHSIWDLMFFRLN